MPPAMSPRLPHMPRRSRVCRHATWACRLALALLLPAPAGALPAAAEPAPGQCRGKNMLAEMQRDEPEAHARIMGAASATANADAVLWRIERDGLAQPSYLLGTVHVTDPRVASLSPTVNAAIDAARSVALEVSDLSPEATAAAISRAAALILYADGRRLDTQLTPAEFEAVKATVASAGMPAEIGALLKPWIVYMMLSVSPCERRKVQQGNLVLDMRIAERARTRGLKVVGLETIDEQLVAMSAVPDDQQLQVLRATLKYARRTDDLLETVLQMYLTRRMGAAVPFQMALAAKAGVDAAPLAAYQRELVLRRNHNMARAMLPLLDKGGAFVAVGALHLVGAEGLVALLRGAGYTVTAVE